MTRKVAFSGISGSGKTTLIEKIAIKLKKENKKILIIKHDPKDKAVFDTKGKDSYRFFETGADVIVASPKKTTHFSHSEQQISDILQDSDPNLDYIFIEGFRAFDMTRITVARGEIESCYIEATNAFAIDDSVDKSDIINKDILDLNDIDSIIKWINTNT